MPGTAAAEQSSCQGTAQTTGVKGGRLCTQTCTLCALRHPLQGTPPRTPAQAQPQRHVMDAACEVAVDAMSEACRAGWRSHMPSNAHATQQTTPACHPRHPHSCTAGQHCYWCWQGSLHGDASTSSDCIGQTSAGKANSMSGQQQSCGDLQHSSLFQSCLPTAGQASIIWCVGSNQHRWHRAPEAHEPTTMTTPSALRVPLCCLTMGL